MSQSLYPQQWSEPAQALGTYVPPGAFGGPEPTRDPEQESVLKVALGFVALLRRNWPLVGFAIVAALGVAAFQIQRTRPEYRANAVLRHVDKSKRMSAGLGSDAAQRLAGPNTDPILTQIQLLQSRAVAEVVVQRDGLRVVPLTRDFRASLLHVVVDSSVVTTLLRAAFGPIEYEVRAGGEVARAPYGSPVQLRGLTVTIAERPAVAAAEFEIVSSDRAIAALQKTLKGRPRERTDIIDLTYTATDPLMAQRVANTAAGVFQELNAKMERQQSVRRRQFIENQLGKVEVRLSEAQLAHNAFRSREQVYSSQQKFATQQTDLSGIELRRQELDADRKIFLSLLQAIQSPKGNATGSERLAALVSSPGVVTNPVVSQLYTQLVSYQAGRDSLTTGQWGSSANNPDVKRLDALIASTEAKVLAAVRGQISSVDARIAALDELRRRTAGQMAELPTTEAEESQLLAQVEVNRKEAERLREELQKAQIEEAAEAGQIDVVDLAAVPLLPIGTGRLPKLVFALLIGLVLGSVAAYIVENYRAVIRVREELERITSITTLALIPKLRVETSKTPLLPRHASADDKHTLVKTPANELVTLHDARSTGAEAYRTLRTNLMFSAAVSGLKRLVVTSASPQEGKSTTISNLAVAMAQQGSKVLLIDCDLRRPRQHKIFSVPVEPGVTNVLLSPKGYRAAIHETYVENLSVLAAGTIPPNPAELLSSPHMAALLDNLGMEFDLLLIDSPPLLAAADAAVLTRLADGAMIVVRAGQTQRGALESAVQQLAQVGGRIIGTVLNDPDGEVPKYAAHYGYYYNNYYDYSAAKG